jgi:predicted transposase YbfD/YdcC
VKAIIESDNYYIITVKRNQPKLHDSIKETAKTQPEDAFSWKQNGHGHSVICRIKVWEAPSSMTEQWTGLSRVISVTRTGIRNGKKFSGETYYITSLKTSAYRLSKAIRGHRRIENNLHWVKDVILNEDNCHIAKPETAATLGIVRDIGFNLLIMEGFNSITNAMVEMEGKIGKLWDIVNNPIKNIFFSFPTSWLGMPSATLCVVGRRASPTAFPTGRWEREYTLRFVICNP